MSKNLLLQEIKVFSRENWWIYIIFFICISIIYYTNTGNIFEITIVFFLWLIILWFYFYFDFINSFGQFLQLIWFTIFASFLSINDEKIKYFWSLVGIFLIFLSSGLETYSSFLISNIKWIDISYTLLPLTVFVFYFKNIKKYLW